jgi:hypothetical protein
MNKNINKPKKWCNKQAKKWLESLYGKQLPEKEAEEAIFNLVNYFKVLKEIAQRKEALDAAYKTRQT